jgi:protein-disulfide isomerase
MKSRKDKGMKKILWFSLMVLSIMACAHTAPVKEETRIAIPISQSPLKGQKNALVTIVEFSEFQCPYCMKGSETLKMIEQIYQGRVNIVFKHFPLDFHQQARPAAFAAIAAQRQGKFWEYHDMLWRNREEWVNQGSDDLFIGYANQLGLDPKKFEADMKDPVTATEVDTDIQLGLKLGVQGVPCFFINGVSLVGAQPVENFREIIDQELMKAQKEIDNGVPPDRLYERMLKINGFQ